MDDQRGLAAIILVLTAFLFWLHTQGKLFDFFGVFFGQGANSSGVTTGTASSNNSVAAQIASINKQLADPNLTVVEKLVLTAQLAILEGTTK